MSDLSDVKSDGKEAAGTRGRKRGNARLIVDCRQAHCRDEGAPPRHGFPFRPASLARLSRPCGTRSDTGRSSEECLRGCSVKARLSRKRQMAWALTPGTKLDRRFSFTLRILLQRLCPTRDWLSSRLFLPICSPRPSPMCAASPRARFHFATSSELGGGRGLSVLGSRPELMARTRRAFAIPSRCTAAPGPLQL